MVLTSYVFDKIRPDLAVSLRTTPVDYQFCPHIVHPLKKRTSNISAANEIQESRKQHQHGTNSSRVGTIARKLTVSDNREEAFHKVTTNRAILIGSTHRNSSKSTTCDVNDTRFVDQKGHASRHASRRNCLFQINYSKIFI
uniref:Uncharacterized protein n=1 Tax=Caenorhabditis japonica TaxID=281687 RepID=A0A8R1E9D4_CAEJA